MRTMLGSARIRLLVIPCAAAVLTVGCGQGSMLQSPTGPSGTMGSTTFLTADDGDVVATAASAGEFDLLGKGGNGKGRGGSDKDKGGDKGKGEDKDKNGEDGPGRSHEARIVGFVTANAGGTLTVEGTAIVAGTDAVIRHGNRMLEISDIEVGDHIQARGAMDGTKLVAEEIKVQDTDHDDDDGVDDAEVEGTISDLSAVTGCPVVTFMIGTTKVTTSAATKFDEVTCATLANGARLEVEGTKQADGSITAASVELK